ncbi:MAG: pyridoxal 5'-phosphate synthase glutaminase subunit PdxT, partial [Bacillota bacterium]
NIIEMVKELGEKGLPIWGTCAGMIIMARKITNSKQTSINLIDITVKRNAFGRQINSFEKELYIKEIGNKPFPAVFIRAPLIMETGNDVKILAKHKDKAVIVRQKNILVSSFHPELTDDLRLHKYFSDMIS